MLLSCHVFVYLQFFIIFDYIKCCVETAGVDVAARVGTVCTRFARRSSAWSDLGVQTERQGCILTRSIDTLGTCVGVG